MATTEDDGTPGIVTDDGKPVMLRMKEADARTALRNAYKLRYHGVEVTTVTMEVPAQYVISELKMQFPFVDAEVRDEWEESHE